MQHYIIGYQEARIQGGNRAPVPSPLPWSSEGGATIWPNCQNSLKTSLKYIKIIKIILKVDLYKKKKIYIYIWLWLSQNFSRGGARKFFALRAPIHKNKIILKGCQRGPKHFSHDSRTNLQDTGLFAPRPPLEKSCIRAYYQGYFLKGNKNMKSHVGFWNQVQCKKNIKKIT